MSRGTIKPPTPESSFPSHERRRPLCGLLIAKGHSDLWLVVGKFLIAELPGLTWPLQRGSAVTAWRTIRAEQMWNVGSVGSMLDVPIIICRGPMRLNKTPFWLFSRVIVRYFPTANGSHDKGQDVEAVNERELRATEVNGSAGIGATLLRAQTMMMSAGAHRPTRSLRTFN